MNNRQVKKILIEKAKVVDIPNVADQIKARLHEIPEPSTAIVRPRKFRLVHVMSLSIIVLLVTTVSLLYYGYRDIDPLASADESLHEAVITSSISTLSLMDDINATATTETSMTTLLAYGTNDDEPDEEAEVTANAAGLRKYMFMMESLLKSEDGFAYERRVISRDQRRYQLQFKTMSLTSQESNYVVAYEVTDDTSEAVEMTLTLYGYDESYESFISYQKKTKAITMTTVVDETHTVRVSFQADDEGKHYEVTRYENLMISEQVSIDYTSRKQINLSFTHGNIYGSYDFSLTYDSKGIKNIIVIDYDIQNRFQGEIRLFVSGDDNETYTMIVRPDGKRPFVVTGPRSRGRN